MATMFEFAIVVFIKQIEDGNTKQVSISKGPLFDNSNYSSKNLNPESDAYLETEENIIPNIKRYSTTQKIDAFALVLFMLMYIIFNTVYFAHYM